MWFYMAADFILAVHVSASEMAREPLEILWQNIRGGIRGPRRRWKK